MAQAKTKRVLDDNGDIVVEKEPTPQEALSALPVTDKPVKAFKKQEEPKTYVYRLISNASVRDSRQYPPKFLLANTDIVVDEETGYKRAARYLPGVNTLWVDEQEKLPANVVNKRPTIEFTDGYLYVPSSDKMLNKFLQVSNRNATNENRATNNPPNYELLNYEAISKKKMDNVKMKHEAMKVALSASEESMMEHSEYLGITSINAQGIEKEIDEIRVEYVSIAENNPSSFLKSYNNPATKAYSLIKRALSSGKLTETIIPGQVHWGETRALVAVIPSGEGTIEYLVKYAFKDGEGKRFYDRLKSGE